MIRLINLLKLFVSILSLVSLTNGAYKLQERYHWNQLDFAFPSASLKQQALATGAYIPQNGLPVGVEHWGNRLFVTVPRWKDGIPATLTYFNMDENPSGSPQLIPYPDWRMNTAGDCGNSITTAYRIKADVCGRLWVLDTGTLGIENTTTNPCPYAVNVFDLHTNTRIRHYELRPEDTNAHTFIANIAVDIGKNCDDAYAYFSDELGYGLIAYSWQKNKSWRFNGHSYFFPDPLKGDFNIGGLNFQWGEEGIFGMSLSPIQADGYRTLFFSPLASHRQFAVSTRVLRDENRVEDSYHEFIVMDERGPLSHTSARVMSDDGIELFNLIDQNSVGCWHSALPYKPQYHDVVDRDDVGLIFPADVKIDENKNVWVLSDRMPGFLLAGLDFNDINFRIYTAPFDLLIEGTLCDTKSYVYGPDNALYNRQCLVSSAPSVTQQQQPQRLNFAQQSSGQYQTPQYYLPQSTPNYNGARSMQSWNGPQLFPPIVVQSPASYNNYVAARNTPWWHQQIQKKK